MSYRNKNKSITKDPLSESNANTVHGSRRGKPGSEKTEYKWRRGKHTVLLLRAPSGSMRSVAGLPRSRGTLGTPSAASAAAANSGSRRVLFSFLRVGRRRLAGGSCGTGGTTSDGLGSITQEREAQPRLLCEWFQGRPSSFHSGEVPHFAVSLLPLPMDTHDRSLLHLLDALIAHGLVVEQGSAHLGQPSVDSRWQGRVTWSAVRVILQIVGFKIRYVELEEGGGKNLQIPKRSQALAYRRLGSKDDTGEAESK